jgi:hypothetical protein
MIRLIGILTGSAIAVAFLIVALGLPEFVAPAPGPEPAMVTVPDAPPATLPDPVPQQLPEPLPEPALEPEPLPEPIQTSSPEPIREQITVVEAVQEPIEQQWYAFWSPFRSEIAANGFVSQLQRTTGLDYRIVNLKPGVYEVAFAYSDDSDIQDKLTQISSATGLDLSGG